MKGRTAALLLALLGPVSANASECVILLHGLARSAHSMAELEEKLTRAGYRVENIDYPSREQAIPELAEQAVAEGLKRCQAASASPVNFVTHSLGGILVRYYYTHHSPDHVGRVVMLGPPNQGSEVVDNLKDVPGFELLNGPAGRQLGTDKQDIPKSLGPVNFELGVIAGTMTRGQTGRNLQRLFEVETYRMMALLAFPIARDMAPRLSRLEAETARVTSRMAEPDADGEDRDLLGELTQIAAEVEGLMAAHGYRFGAARAYHAIVQRSLRELREEPLPGTQTFTKFLDRRFSPAMRTCDAMAKRADALGRRVSRTANLLRTRVDVTLEENNRDLLRSMNRRAKLQLRLQETVEGLSVVAISYYGWGLLSYMLKGVKAAGVPFDTELASLVAVPMVVAVVFFALRRLRKLAGTHG